MNNLTVYVYIKPGRQVLLQRTETHVYINITVRTRDLDKEMITKAILQTITVCQTDGRHLHVCRCVLC